MIVTFLLQIAANFVTGWASLTSGVATLPSSISDAIVYVISGVNQFSFIIPTDALWASLAIVLTYEAAMWTFKASVWIYRHIPFLGH